jgi:NitT/TauT family transport system ATP-binding protein
MARPVLIDIQGVAKQYEAGSGPIRALDPTDLSIGAGEFVSIVGPSGCGKTTMLKMIGGLIQPSGGAIRVADAPVDGPRDDVGMVFQNAVLLPWKNVLDNILLPIRVRMRPSAEEIDRAGTLIKLVGLDGFARRHPFELSGGMQQRVSICRALIRDPACLLLDEPFGALDALTRENLNVLFNGLWRQTGKTVLLVTHSIQEAVFLSNRVIVMSKRPGAIVEDVAVPFADERKPEIMASPEFGQIAARIRCHFTDSAME